VLGGLLAFGLVGLFAGPIILAVAWSVWREWTAHLDDENTGTRP
jgi:predicted PurR-regulated permease PerM